MSKTPVDLSHLARPGAEIAVRVTPKAARNMIELREGQIRIYTTTVPENGKATAETTKLLAKALGVPKSRLSLIKGQTSRDKLYKLV